MELEVQRQEHELGSYPLIVLTWEDGMRGAPWNYISRCETALTAYENGEELSQSWSMTSDDDSEGAPFDPEKALPDPPDNLNLFVLQRYVGKLIGR